MTTSFTACALAAPVVRLILACSWRGCSRFANEVLEILVQPQRDKTRSMFNGI
jgi:hypothetical protein